jgi:hypothetical protein
MNTTLLLVILVALLGLCVVAAATAAVEHTTRTTAWRQIALERRWNHEKNAGHADR